jgi:hypothetical protein
MKKLRFISLMAVMVLTVSAFLLVRCTKDQTATHSNSLSGRTLASTSSSAAVQAATFIHPGILNTQASLDYIAAQVNNNTDADRVTAYNLVTDYCNSHNPSGGYKVTIQVASRAGTTDEGNF